MGSVRGLEESHNNPGTKIDTTDGPSDGALRVACNAWKAYFLAYFNFSTGDKVPGATGEY